MQVSVRCFLNKHTLTPPGHVGQKICLFCWFFPKDHDGIHLMKNKLNIIVGMSGGVDSSVAAYLLKEAGHTVAGLFMKNWEGDDTQTHCPAELDLKDAKAVADKLNIPLHVVNFSKDYWDRVFEHFLDEYAAGRTPNPDILCNKEIKFRAFLDEALSLGADAIATGHYAQIQTQQDKFQLVKGLDPLKDQSYFLHLLNQRALANTLFPIGHLPKTTVRAIAQAQGFVNAKKKDSTGICFIGERKFKTFLQEYLPAQPGVIETLEGDEVGMHEGLMYHTVGQRKGLLIGGLKKYDELPWYVVDKDVQRNVLVVAQGSEHPALFKMSLHAIHPHWISGVAPVFPLKCQAKIRYRQADQACTVHCEGGMLAVHFAVPQRAVTPGQAIVFYEEAICLGGATII